MSKFRLQISHFGPISQADVTFGDLTVLVGPQATGKSVFLQALKLIVDKGAIRQTLKQHGLVWGESFGQLCEAYFGEGMAGLWTAERSSLCFNGHTVTPESLVGGRVRQTEETLFYVPAQRVLTLRDGWPRSFMDYRPGDPFVVRQFSEALRLWLENGWSPGDSVFPQKGRWPEAYRNMVDEGVFDKRSLRVDALMNQKRLVLGGGAGEANLPFMVWSAGQREYVPMLLALYWLLPSGKISVREQVQWVVIEEPEMGLHPKATTAVLVMAMEMLARGYRVCLSTHSPHVLDIVWAFQIFKEHGSSPQRLLEVLGMGGLKSFQPWAKHLLTDKVAKVYYFDRDAHPVQDISKLDLGSDNPKEQGWGGLSGFSGNVADVVAMAVSESERRKAN